VGPSLVIIPPRLLNLDPGVGEVEEPVRRETFVPQLAVKALDVRVFYRLAWVDEEELDPATIDPRVECPARELAPIVADQRGGQAAALASCSSTAIRASLDRCVSTAITGHSLVKSSMTVKTRNGRPSANVSWTKSID